MKKFVEPTIETLYFEENVVLDASKGDMETTRPTGIDNNIENI